VSARGVLRAFGFAWDGLAEGAVRDRNLRVHLALGVLAGAFVAHAPLAPVERAILVLCVAAVVSAEAMNSAVEAAVDLASPGFDERARIAKDCAAAAVLALAAGSVLALLAIAGAHAPELAAWLGGLSGAAALRLSGAVAAAAAAAGLLPAPGGRSRAGDALLLACGAGGIAALAAGASSAAGVATAALCLAVSAGGASRRRVRRAQRAAAEHHSS
jgi:diacylglycerol kinase (ATP)